MLVKVTQRICVDQAVDKWGSIDFLRGGVEGGGGHGRDGGRVRTDWTMCPVCCLQPSDDVATLIPTRSSSAPTLPSSLYTHPTGHFLHPHPTLSVTNPYVFYLSHKTLTGFQPQSVF